MLNRIISVALKNRVVVLLLMLIIMIWGGITMNQMDVDVFPDLTAPTVTIMTEAHGMATEEVELLVSYPIESALNGSPNVRRIRSSSSRGFSIVWAEFEWGTDIYKARQIVSEKLGTVRDKLPIDVNAPILAPISSIMGEVMLISVSSDSIDAMELRSTSDWVIRQQLLSVQGVAQVVVIGGNYKEYQILASPDQLEYYNVTLQDLKNTLELSNRNVSGGILAQHGNQYVIRGQGRSQSVDDIGSLLIKKIEGVGVKVSDVAAVKIGASPKIGDGSAMAKDAVILTVLKQPNANTIELTERLDKAISVLEKQLPKAININSKIFRQSDFIQSSIDNLQQTLLEGGVFVALVLLLFLMNWRTTVISLITIPISLLVTILILKYLGFTINTMSLGGMAIAIGALVDDAIIDVENIYKKLRENILLPEAERKSVSLIVYEASSEIRNSILIATLIIVVSFIPLFTLSGMEGRLLEPLGISFIVSLLMSLVVAVTVTPVLSTYLLGNENRLKKGAEGSFVERFLGKNYSKVLVVVLKAPKSIVVFTVLLFILSIGLFTQLGRSFLPSFNEGALVINVDSSPGISLEESNKMGRLAETIILSVPEIDLISRRTGRAELAEHTQGVNSSEIDASFTLQGRSQEDFLSELRTKLSVVPGANITIGQPIEHRIDHMLSGTRANIAIKVFGPNLGKLYNIGNSIKDNISSIEGVVDLTVEQQIEVPQIKIEPKRAFLAMYGIQLNDLLDFIDVAFGGEIVGQVFEEQKSFNMVLRFDEVYRKGLDDIKNAKYILENGESVALSSIADIKVIGSPYTINRENAQRKLVVSANVSGRDLRGVVNDIQQNVGDNVLLPENYRIEYGGQFESEERASKMLMMASIGAFVLIYLLLFFEFGNFKLASVVLINLPMALIGGIIIVYFTSGIVSIASIIGFVSLFGIASRNGILLVSHYQQLLSEGKDLFETIVVGSKDRLNPILMTALTTGLALIPLALANDKAGNEIQSPMAVVILGGLISSTLLNLLVIPAIFYLINNKKKAL
jgi:CzcA family heavy metal efflux pump